MTNTLPIAIISAHSGLKIPPEVADRIALTNAQIFNESDAYTDTLYDFGQRVRVFEHFPYARAIIDVNRPADSRAFARAGDAAVKRQTSYGAPVYAPGQEPDAALEQALIARYWQPWQDKLARIANDPTIKLVIDGHSMAALGPPRYSDPEALRPLSQVGNYGDRNGNPIPGQRSITAFPEQAHLLVNELNTRLADLDPVTAIGPVVTLNHPFRGGYHLAKYGGQAQPWLMIELNRGLYMGQQSGDSPITTRDTQRIAAIRERLWAAIEAIARF